LMGLSIAALIAVTGCSGTSGTTGGGGGTSKPGGKPLIGEAEGTFSLSPPTLSPSIKQGEVKEVTITITRGKNFAEDVELKFGDLPKGITIEPAKVTIKHGDSEAKLTVKAANDAALGDHTIRLTGHPTKGKDKQVDLKITVNKK